MAICMVPPLFGSLLDPFGGETDLQSGVFRVLHGLLLFSKIQPEYFEWLDIVVDIKISRINTVVFG